MHPRLPPRIARLLLAGTIPPGFDTPCWIFTGRWTTGNGYAKTLWRGSHRVLHRVVWEIIVGWICPGFLLDHKCRNRGCSNPDHLTPVPHEVNTRRGAAKLFKRREEYQSTYDEAELCDALRSGAILE